MILSYRLRADEASKTHPNTEGSEKSLVYSLKCLFLAHDGSLFAPSQKVLVNSALFNDLEVAPKEILY